MQSMLPKLDHLVVNARDALDDVAALYERLGFHLTPPSRHTLGSVNRTAVFGASYLELVGIDRDAAAPRAELLRAPLGLEGLVFATDDASGLYRALAERGIAAAPPVAFSRPVGDGEARFRVVRLPAAPFGRCYFCEHLTPGLVWREDWRQHPNGAFEIAHVTIGATDPEALAAYCQHLFEESVERAGIAIVPDARDRMLAIEFRVRDLDETRRALERGAIAAAAASGRITVPPEAAMGATLVFAQ